MNILITIHAALAGCLLVGASSHALKCWGFDPLLGHTPRLWVQSTVGAYMGGNQSMYLSHINVSLFPLLSL